MNITAVVANSNRITSKMNVQKVVNNNNFSDKVIDIKNQIKIENTEKLNIEFKKLEEKINNEIFLNSIKNNDLKKDMEIDCGYHGPRNYYGLESIIEFCNSSLNPITKLEKLYLDKLYLYIEYANMNNLLEIKKERNIIYSKETENRKKIENSKKTTNSNIIEKELNDEIDTIVLEDIINTDNNSYNYLFSKRQMAIGFRMFISEIVELIKYSKIDKLIIEDKQNKYYLAIDDNLEEAFFCLKKITYIMNTIMMSKTKEKQKIKSIN